MKNRILPIVMLGFLLLTNNACHKDNFSNENNVSQSKTTYSENSILSEGKEILLPCVDVYAEQNWKILSFSPYARAFAVDANDPKLSEILSLYKKAMLENQPLEVEFAEYSGLDFYVVKSLNQATDNEIRNWHDAQGLNQKSTTELRGSYSAKLPSYKVASDIFNYLSRLTCVSTSTGACIPFNFVADGCYARAHAMKKVMQEKFGYTCAKAVTRGYNGQATLSVQSNKLGCCVRWRWHIAPAVLVWENNQWIEYVLDPSMFSRPVKAQDWANAQGNRNCYNNAWVNGYKTYNGNVYTVHPATGAIAEYDDDYTKTYAELYRYSRRYGCSN